MLLCCLVGGVGQGEFDGFTRKWYAMVGATLLMTMLVNIIIPHVGPFVSRFVVLPLKARFAFKRSLSQVGERGYRFWFPDTCIWVWISRRHTR